MITVKLKRGAGIPTTSQLSEYELGWSVDQKKLYINDNGTISLAAGAISLGLNGSTASNEGTFNFYAPTAVTGGAVVKIKDTVVAGEDPFTYVSVDTNPADASTNLVSSGGVFSALSEKVDKATGYGLIADTDYAKLTNIETGAQVNKIETVKLNGTSLAITDKTVDVSGVEVTSNKVSSWSQTVTDTNYPSEKLVKNNLDTKLTKVITDSGVTTSVNNSGTEFNLSNEVSGGTAVRLHFASGESYLAKYSTGDTVTYTDGNRLLNKAEIAAMITGDASRLITSRSGSAGSYVYGPFASNAALLLGPWYYQGTQVETIDLNNGDYVYVKDDELHANKQTMYVWDGAQWSYAISFSEDPLVPDNTTLELFNDGVNIRIKDGGVGESQLATDAVTTSKIKDANVTLSKLVTSTVTGDGRIIGYDIDNNPYIIGINNFIESPSNIFAPTSSGTSGQYLKAVENSAPVWENFPTIPSITLNGSSTTNAIFYAPSSSGTAGQILLSGGLNTVPSWSSTIDGGTWTPA